MAEVHTSIGAATFRYLALSQITNLPLENLLSRRRISFLPPLARLLALQTLSEFPTPTYKLILTKM